MSTNTGRAPACEIASVVAMKVFGTVTTMSPGPDSRRDQREPQRIGAAADSDAMLRVAELREILLEALHHRAADEAGRIEGGLEDLRPVRPSAPRAE